MNRIDHLGIAVRVRAGSMEALPALVAWALHEHAPGAFALPDAWAPLVVRNVVGREVGGWHVEPD